MEQTGKSGWNRARRLNLKTGITLVLIGMMYIVVLLSVIDLGWNLFRYITATPIFIVQPDELQDLLGLFLLVLVGIELLDTVQAYLNEDVVHAEVVLEAALIAVARKIIVLDSKETSAPTIIAIASLVLVLGAAYFVVKQAHNHEKNGHPPKLSRTPNPPPA